MAIDLRAFKVFISSPSGLGPERRTFYRTVLEMNEIEAEARKRTFIPVGSERQVAGVIRPQAHFNDQLRDCDYLVLILADRWGSPTSLDENGFSSGTEEEYTLARELLLGEEPMKDIVVLFKGVPERQLVDPGEQLQKVLDFKAALEEEKSLLFATFDGEEDLSRILRLHLMRWLRGEDDPDGGLGAEARKDSPPPTSPSSSRGAEKSRAVGPKGKSPLADARQAARSGEQAKAEGEFARALRADADDLETLMAYARFLRHNGRFSHAMETSRKLIQKASSQGEVEWQIKGLANLGISQRGAGLLEDSQASLNDGITLAAESGDPATVAYLANNLGLTLRRAGELGQAEAQYARAMRVYEECQDEVGLAHALTNLSYVIREQGDLDQARLHAERVTELGNPSPQSMAMAHCNLGLIAEDEHALDEAEKRFQKALEINKAMRNSAGQALNYAYLGRVKLEKGDEAGALKSAGYALELNEWRGNREGIAMSLHVLAQIDLRKENFASAESRLRDALDIYVVLQNRIGIAGCWADLAFLLARTLRIADAEGGLAEARAAAEGVEHKSVQRRLAQAEEEVRKAGGLNALREAGAVTDDG